MILEILAYITVGIISLAWILTLVTSFAKQLMSKKKEKELKITTEELL